MTVRVRGGRFMLDLRHHHSDGRVERIRIAVPKDKQSRRAAEAYERTVLADLDRGIMPRQAPERPREVPTLAAFAAEYLSRCDATNRPQYARKKARILSVQLLPTFGAMRLDEIGARTIDAYRATRAKDVSAKWINEAVGVLLHVLRTAHTWEVTTAVPKVKPLRTMQPEIEHLAPEEQDRLVAAATKAGTPWAAMVVTALRTGLRLGELRGLRWRDVDTTAGRIVVRVAADECSTLHAPKSGKPREVPLGDDVLAVLKRHRHARVHVFDDDGAILSPGQCRKALDRIVRQAGLGPMGWHRLRHTFASELVQRGATMRAVQDLLGHGTMAMTVRYAHLSPDARRDAVRLLDRGHSLGTVPAEPSTTAN